MSNPWARGYVPPHTSDEENWSLTAALDADHLIKSDLTATAELRRLASIDWSIHAPITSYPGFEYTIYKNNPTNHLLPEKITEEMILKMCNLPSEDIVLFNLPTIHRMPHNLTDTPKTVQTIPGRYVDVLEKVFVCLAQLSRIVSSGNVEETKSVRIQDLKNWSLGDMLNGAKKLRAWIDDEWAQTAEQNAYPAWELADAAVKLVSNIVFRQEFEAAALVATIHYYIGDWLTMAGDKTALMYFVNNRTEAKIKSDPVVEFEKKVRKNYEDYIKRQWRKKEDDAIGIDEDARLKKLREQLEKMTQWQFLQDTM